MCARARATANLRQPPPGIRYFAPTRILVPRQVPSTEVKEVKEEVEEEQSRMFGISSASGEFDDSAPTTRRIFLISGMVRFTGLIVNISEDGARRSTPSWLDEALKSAPFTKISKVTYFNVSSNHEGMDLPTPSFDMLTMRSINLTIPETQRILLIMGVELTN